LAVKKHRFQKIPAAVSDFSEIPKPEPVNTDITGTVMDENNKLSGMQVVLNETGYTNNGYGIFVTGDITTDKYASTFSITSGDPLYIHNDIFKTFTVTNSIKNYVTVRVVNRIDIGVIDNSTGGSVTLPNGAQLSLRQIVFTAKAAVLFLTRYMFRLFVLIQLRISLHPACPVIQ